MTKPPISLKREHDHPEGHNDFSKGHWANGSLGNCVIWGVVQ